MYRPMNSLIKKEWRVPPLSLSPPALPVTRSQDLSRDTRDIGRAGNWNRLNDWRSKWADKHIGTNRKIQGDQCVEEPCKRHSSGWSWGFGAYMDWTNLAVHWAFSSREEELRYRLRSSRMLQRLEATFSHAFQVIKSIAIINYGKKKSSSFHDI